MFLVSDDDELTIKIPFPPVEASSLDNFSLARFVVVCRLCILSSITSYYWDVEAVVEDYCINKERRGTVTTSGGLLHQQGKARHCNDNKDDGLTRSSPHKCLGR